MERGITHWRAKQWEEEMPYANYYGAVQKKMIDTFIILFTEKTSIDEHDAIFPKVVLC